MNIFFHHVGQDGANRDFPRTVFNKLYLHQLIADSVISDPELIKSIKEVFPSGSFNCWGVPSGAGSVIRNLRGGDYVFLVESSRIDGAVPVLCPVKIFPKFELGKLSEHLWQDAKFSYIFFFDTVTIDLMWIQFLEDMEYKENFSPRGNFYKVDGKRFDKFGGPSAYVSNILRVYSGYSGEDMATSVVNENSEKYCLFDIQYAEDKLVALAKNEPLLRDNIALKRTIKTTKREQAFRILIKRLYNYRCAICNVSLKSPAGDPAVHASHIYPKNQNGSDDLRNGICLCFLHHWALDAGWMAIGDDYKILLRKGVPRTKEYEGIYKYEDSTIGLPKDRHLWPHPIFLSASRAHYGF